MTGQGGTSTATFGVGFNALRAFGGIRDVGDAVNERVAPGFSLSYRSNCAMLGLNNQDLTHNVLNTTERQARCHVGLEVKVEVRSATDPHIQPVVQVVNEEPGLP